LVWASLSGAAFAESSPRPGPLDGRIRTIVYNPDQVVAVPASYGASTMIVFSDDERVETLAAGDALAWKVEPNHKGNVLFIKPIQKNAAANLNVLTNKRSYVFLLQAEFRPVDQEVFKIVFKYPDEDVDKSLMAEARQRAAAAPNQKDFKAANANASYGYKGSSVNKPIAVFDDGVKTWFRFPTDAEMPSIFIVDKERNESLVNARRVGDYIVVDKVNFQWTLRNGEEATCIFNLRLNNVNEPTGLEPYTPQRLGEPPAQSAGAAAAGSADGGSHAIAK
jgi:P-type conjugative transfer protein VirB9